MSLSKILLFILRWLRGFCIKMYTDLAPHFTPPIKAFLSAPMMSPAERTRRKNDIIIGGYLLVVVPLASILTIIFLVYI